MPVRCSWHSAQSVIGDRTGRGAPPTSTLSHRISRKAGTPKNKGRTPCGGPPLSSFASLRFTIPDIFYYPIRVSTAVLDCRTLLSSHRPYGVRRQTFWQRPPFGDWTLVQIFGDVTWLSASAMHIFSSLANFGQMCAAQCKSAVQPDLPHRGRLSSVTWMP